MNKLFLVIFLSFFLIANTRADNSALGVVKGTGGVLVGTPVSFFTGMVRGAVTKAVSFTDAIQDGFGNETTLSKIVSFPVGVISGGIIGGAAGAIKGVGNGIYYGVKDPFSQQNFTVDGDFADFDAFDFADSAYREI